MTDCITPAFAARHRSWCELYAPLDLEHFAGQHKDEPNPECPKCQVDMGPPQGTLL